MRFLKIIIITMAVSAFLDTVSAQENCEKRLQEYMKGFPESDLCDVYKFCFQDVFGPAHLNIDSAAAIKSIEGELAKAKTLGGPDYQYVGCEGNYVRVNLRLVKNGTLSVSKLAGYIARSSQTPVQMTVEEWHYRWDELEEVASKLNPRPGHFSLDSQSLNDLLERGGYAAHHSYAFNSTYNFRYRIVRKDLFEAEILPMLPKGKHK